MAESRALRQLVQSVNATGGVIRLPSGCVAPKADEDWIDLGDVDLEACNELGIPPVIEAAWPFSTSMPCPPASAP